MRIVMSSPARVGSYLQNKASILALEANIDELETKLNLRTDVTEKNDEQMKELRAQLASSTAAYDEQQHRNNELSEQMKTMKTQYEQKVRSWWRVLVSSLILHDGLV